jgi:hypothetical protein
MLLLLKILEFLKQVFFSESPVVRDVNTILRGICGLASGLRVKRVDAVF